MNESLPKTYRLPDDAPEKLMGSKEALYRVSTVMANMPALQCQSDNYCQTMLKSNYFIINKKAREFSEMRIAGHVAVFIDEAGKPVDFGVLPLDDSIYTIMSCDEMNLVMMVIDRQGSRTVEGVIWKDVSDYRAGAEALKKASGVRLSKQDLKISSYAWAVAKKLDDGMQVKITDAVDASDMVVCPECGMLNPKGSDYCLDCGAELYT